MTISIKSIVLAALVGASFIALPAFAGVQYLSEETSCSGMSSVRGANYMMKLTGGDEVKRCLYWKVSIPSCSGLTCLSRSAEVTWHGNGKHYNQARFLFEGGSGDRYNGSLDVWSGKGFTAATKRTYTDSLLGSTIVRLGLAQADRGIKSFKSSIYAVPQGD